MPREYGPFSVKKHYKAYSNEGRAVLTLLGIGSNWALSALSGLGHETSGALLGIFEPRNRPKPRQIVRFLETLHSSYVEIRERLRPMQRAMICEWVEAWKERITSEFLFVDMDRVRNCNKWDVEKLVREKKSILKTTLDAMNGLEWKP